MSILNNKKTLSNLTQCLHLLSTARALSQVYIMLNESCFPPANMVPMVILQCMIELACLLHVAASPPCFSTPKYLYTALQPLC